MTTTTGAATLPATGDIHRMYVTWHYVDGSYRHEARDGIVLDAEHGAAGAAVTWMLMEGTGADYLPSGEPMVAVFPYHTWPAGAVNWSHSDMTATHWVALAERVGAYKPRDPGANSAGILRDEARARLAVRRLPDDVTRSVREVAARLDDLPGRRDRLIREALAIGVRADDLAADARLSIGRIYQIRDGKR